MRKRIQNILSSMKAGTYERDDALVLSLLSALSGESIFLLGLPGVGKSMIARRLKMAFRDASVFEYLMSRFSTPDEIFGPVSISKLKDEDCYERVVEGYLPSAEVVFLDEIWKAGPAIQNSLLTVLNEKIFLNGNNELHLPLKGIIAASNELPAKGEGLEALWDRFLLRYIVNPITQKQHFFSLLCPTNEKSDIEEYEPLTHDDYIKIQSESRAVKLPDNILEVIYQIREKLNERINSKDVATREPDPENQKYYISDRRWKKAVGVMRMSAYLNGRQEVDYTDILLLTHMLWSDESSIPIIRQMIVETIVTSLFREILERYKSYKRHAHIEQVDNSLYSPDNECYIVQCDDSPLKIAIKDYNHMKKSPDEVFFGSETLDGKLMLRNRGQFVMRFVKDGTICINNYNYHLRTVSDNQLSKDFIGEVGESIETIANQLFVDMNHNMFVVHSDIYTPLKEVVAIYQDRMNTL